jgi:hypothetical protein
LSFMLDDVGSIVCLGIRPAQIMSENGYSLHIVFARRV